MIQKPISCVGCPLFGSGRGYVPMEAPTAAPNGVVVILEAGGAEEEAAGKPTCGKAGYYLWSNLQRVNLLRENFRIHNILSCRPPNNKLAGMPYEDSAVEHCSGYLKATLNEHKRVCAEHKQTPVVLALGVIAFRNIMGLKRGDHMLAKDYHSYVHWSQKHEIYVIAGFHPSYLMRGNHRELPTLLFAAQRAVEVARDGFKYDQPGLLLDPEAHQFRDWVKEYFRVLAADSTNTFLSIDIETPKKSKADEDELAREDDEDYIILRCSFAYRTDSAVSIPWTAEYMPYVEAIFADPRNQLVGWNLAYDIPRISAQLPVSGKICDGMLWWHVLNSALDKRLGFVTPYYWLGARMWKHMSEDQPAYYNCLDALAALINLFGIRRDLQKSKLWNVVDRHVIKLGEVLAGMSKVGLLRDEAGRLEAETTLTGLLNTAEKRILAAVPDAAKRLKVYKAKPKAEADLKSRLSFASVKVCDRCGVEKPKKDHFKVYKKKVNECAGAAITTVTKEVTQWYRELPWKPSNTQMQVYQKVLKQQPVWNRQKGSITFDENAIRDLLIKYPDDPLYPAILEHRKVQKLRGTYVGVTQIDGKIKGGLRIGRDGRIHPEYTMNPSTLRLACQNPNMQNLPRSGKEGSLESIVRNLVIAGDGMLLVEADYAAIEAVLSAYFARWKDGLRLARLGVHSYLASFVLGRKVDLAWSDEDLKQAFGEIKGSSDPDVKQAYNACKRTVHLSNYGGSPRKMVMAEPDTFKSVKQAEHLQGMYFEVASPIRKWQLQTQMEADKEGCLINPYGYRHSFHHVFHNVLEYGQWVRKPGDDANAVLAFLPQSTAAGILKEAMIRLYTNHFDTVGQYLRLQVHDSLLCEVPKGQVEALLDVLLREMLSPIPELPLPASYGMGEYLQIGVDWKMGTKWGSLK